MTTMARHITRPGPIPGFTTCCCVFAVASTMAASPLATAYQRQPILSCHGQRLAFVSNGVARRSRVRNRSRDSGLAFHSPPKRTLHPHPSKISMRDFTSNEHKNARYRIVHGSASNNNNPTDNRSCEKLPTMSKSSRPSTDAAIESQTLEWIRKVVIGYNLCPFAEKPLRERNLKLSVVRGNDDNLIASTVLYETIAQTERPGTTVVIAPEYHPDDFERYMTLVQYLEQEILEEHEDLRGVVQIAPFHPLFQFEGSGTAGVDNYTNRSPYPMFHILRENEVSKAVDKLGGDASKVWERNVRLLETMEITLGRAGVEKAMRGESVEGMDDVLKEVKGSGFLDAPEKHWSPGT